MTRLVVILTLLTCSLPSRAGNFLKTQWEQLCSASTGQKLSVSTVDGKTVLGECESTDATTLRLNQGSGRVISMERKSIKQIAARDPHRAFTSVWGFCLAPFFLLAFNSDWSPIAYVFLPVALGAGAVASPFAFMIDLLDLTSDTKIEIVGP